MEVLYSNQQFELKDNLLKMQESDDVKSVLFLMTNDLNFSEEFLTPLLYSFKKPLIGGVFHEVIYKSERKNTGVLLIPLLFDLKTQVFDYNDTSKNIFDKLDISFSDTLSERGSVFIFTDAFTPSKSLFIE